MIKLIVILYIINELDKIKIPNCLTKTFFLGIIKNKFCPMIN